MPPKRTRGQNLRRKAAALVAAEADPTKNNTPAVPLVQYHEDVQPMTPQSPPVKRARTAVRRAHSPTPMSPQNGTDAAARLGVSSS